MPFSRGSAANIPVSTYLFQDNQPLPRSYNTTIGVQHQLLSSLAVGVDYVNSKGRELLQMIETNPVQPATLTRLDPTRGFVRRIESRGYSNYDGLLVSANARIGTRAQVGVAYTLAAYKTSQRPRTASSRPTISTRTIAMRMETTISGTAR